MVSFLFCFHALITQKNMAITFSSQSMAPIFMTYGGRVWQTITTNFGNASTCNKQPHTIVLAAETQLLLVNAREAYHLPLRSKRKLCLYSISNLWPQCLLLLSPTLCLFPRLFHSLMEVAPPWSSLLIFPAHPA